MRSHIPGSTLASAALLLLFVGCAGTRAGRSAEVARLRNTPPPPLPFADRHATVDVDDWRLVGPLPETTAPEPHPAATAFDRRLEWIAQRSAGRLLLTRDMQCVAREVGEFYLSHRKMPTTELRAFIGARCGSASGEPWFEVLESTDPLTAAEARAEEEWREPVDEFFSRLPDEPDTWVGGTWFGHAEGRTVLIAARDAKRASLAPRPFRASGGTVVIQGELTAPATRVFAHATRGVWGFDDCKAVGAVRLPRFRFECPVTARATSTSIVIHASDEHHSRHVLSTVALAGDDEGRLFKARRLPDDARPGDAPESDTQRILRLVNNVRAEQGMVALALAPRESAAAAGLTGHYLASQYGAAPLENAAMIRRELDGGWDVDGPVLSSATVGTIVERADAAYVVSDLLGWPGGWEALVDASARVVAIATTRDDQRGAIGALITTYELADPLPYEARVEAVLARLTEARAKLDRAPPTRIRRLETTAQAMTKLLDDPTSDAMNVLEDFLYRTEWSLQKVPRGWLIEAWSFDTLEFPRELLYEPNLEVGVAASVQRRAGERRAFLQVIMVMTHRRPNP